MKRIVTLVIPCIIMSCILTACSKYKAANTSDEVSTQETSEKAKVTPQPTAASAVVTPLATSPVASATVTPTVTPTTEPVITYQDGSYEVTTAPDYEGYYVKATVVIEDGIITKADWTIYDSNHNDKPFDESYKSVFEGNDYYMQQCIDDWNGSRGYSEDLIETQSPDEVDAVSGATWTCSKFKEGIIAALGQATTNSKK